MAGAATSVDAALAAVGTGRFQHRLLGIFGLVWAADAMQVLAIGFAAPTLAAEFGIAVAQAVQVGTAFFLGMMLGAYGFGRLADRYGRRRILIATVLADAVFGLLSALAPDLASLVVLRLLTGVAVGGTLPVDYAAMAEFLPAERRGRWLVLLEGFWAVGTLALALASFSAAALAGAAAWRWILAATAAPALIGLALRLWVPETPYHLWRTGRLAEAQAVLARMAAVNGRPAPALALAPDPGPPAPRPSLFAGGLRRTSALILATWLLVAMAYYGLFVWLPAQLAAAGHGFLRGQGFLVLVALAQIPGYALAAHGVERWGRRATLVGFLMAAAAGCFLYAATADPRVIAGATLVMSFAMLGAWGALYAFTPELYPTALRASGMGAAGALARLGGLVAPSGIGLVAARFEAAVALFAVLLVLAAGAVLAIRAETRGAPLA